MWVVVGTKQSYVPKPVLECTRCQKRFYITPADAQAFVRQNPPVQATVRGPAPAERLIVACPRCQSQSRVPRVTGKIRVTCPSCATKFEVAGGIVGPDAKSD